MQAEGQELQQVQAVHRRLLGQLTQVLSSPNTSSRETAVAVAGIGHLAAPTKRFFGQQVTYSERPFGVCACACVCAMFLTLFGPLMVKILLLTVCKSSIVDHAALATSVDTGWLRLQLSED